MIIIKYSKTCVALVIDEERHVMILKYVEMFVKKFFSHNKLGNRIFTSRYVITASNIFWYLWVGSLKKLYALVIGCVANHIEMSNRF